MACFILSCSASFCSTIQSPGKNGGKGNLLTSCGSSRSPISIIQLHVFCGPLTLIWIAIVPFRALGLWCNQHHSGVDFFNELMMWTRSLISQSWEEEKNCNYYKSKGDEVILKCSFHHALTVGFQNAQRHSEEWLT